MKSFLKLTWTTEQVGGRWFIREETTGDGPRNGFVLLGPCSDKEEADALLTERHRLMGSVFREIRQRMEASLAELKRAA